MNFLRKIRWLFILILLITGFVLVSSLKIQQIDCTTQFGPCPDKYLAVFDQFRGKKLFSKILYKFPDPEHVKDIQISRKLPQTLVVSFLLRQPIVNLGLNLAVDEEGMVMSVPDSPALPTLLISDPLRPGDRLNNHQLQAILIVKKITETLDVPLKGELSQDTLNIKYNSTIIIFDVRHLTDNWQVSLQKLLTRSKIKGRYPKTIDLRFSQPVLTY